MNRKGFTLIELVMVLVLIGIIAMFVAPRMVDVAGTKAGAFRDKLRADIRYAQNLAMTRNLRSRVDFSTLNQYSVQSSTTSTCSAFPAAIDPAISAAFTVVLNTGDYVGITLTLPAPMNCLEYDSLGRPYDCTGLGLACAGPALLSGMTVTVNANAVAVDNVTVTAQTGAVN
ncbi:MAG: type II secretion system GspH family protein [Nitrospirae bacterium]|nr:type II secretion system GspH family protein [Nitrospirota bacterium]